MKNPEDSRPVSPLHDLQGRIAANLATHAQEIAIEFRGRAYTRGEIRDHTDKLERLLSAHLESPQHAVGIAIRNRPMHLASLWGLVAAGRPAAFLNPFQDPQQLAADVRRLRPAALIADAEDWRHDALREAAHESGTLGIALGESLADSAVPVEGLPATHLADRDALPGVAVEMLSGGTSGAPKRIPLTYRALGFSIVERQALPSARMGEAPAGELAGTLIQYGPVVHLGGLFTALQAAMEGRRLALFEKFEVSSWLEAVRKYRPTMLGLPPAQMRMVLEAGVAAADLAGTRGARSGNAMLDAETRDRFEERYGIPVLSIYGATEYCGPIASWTLDDDTAFGKEKRGSVGRIWVNIAEARVVDPATRAALPSGDIGALEVHIPTVGEDWITTNDLASIDADGFLYLHGRADDAINRGGFKILPTLIADALRRHPAVADVIVLGLPDPRLGQVPVAAVEHRAGADAPSGEALRDFLRGQLTAYQVPARIVVVPALPRTPAMKLSRPEILRLFE